MLSAVTDNSIIQLLANFPVLGGLIINPDLTVHATARLLEAQVTVLDSETPTSKADQMWLTRLAETQIITMPCPHPQFTEKCHASVTLAQHSICSSKPQQA